MKAMKEEAAEELAGRVESNGRAEGMIEVFLPPGWGKELRDSPADFSEQGWALG